MASERAAVSGAQGIGGRVRRAATERILAAAEQVFADHGFAGAKMADIAALAALPKANLHYYFGTKDALYRAVLENILGLWLDAADGIRDDRDPAGALTEYVGRKMAYSRERPHASRIFASEVLHGAPHLKPYLALELRRRVEEKAAVVEGWIARGLMTPVDPRHLFFTLWAMTQTYADFDVQIRAVLGVERLLERDYAAAGALVVRMVLGACGLNGPGAFPHGAAKQQPGTNQKGKERWLS